MTLAQEKNLKKIIFAVLIAAVVIYLTPLALMLLNAVKEYDEIMKDVLALPKKFSLKNFAVVFSDMNYPLTFWNTAVVTVVGLAGIVLFGDRKSVV